MNIRDFCKAFSFPNSSNLKYTFPGPLKHCETNGLETATTCGGSIDAYVVMRVSITKLWGRECASGRHFGGFIEEVIIHHRIIPLFGQRSTCYS